MRPTKLIKSRLLGTSKFSVILLLSVFTLVLASSYSIAGSTNVTKDSLIDSIELKPNVFYAFDSLKVFLDSLNQTQKISVVVFEKEKSSTDWFRYLFPIVTLLLGIWIKWYMDEYKEKNRFKDTGIRWLEEVRALKEPIQKQLKYCESFLTKLEDEKVMLPQLEIMEILNCEVFKSLDKGHLLKAIERNESDKSKAVLISNQLHGFVGILSGIQKRMLDRHERYQENHSALITILNKYLQELFNNFAEYSLERESEVMRKSSGLSEKEIMTVLNKDEDFRQLTNLFYDQYESGENGAFDIYSVNNNFIAHLIPVLSKLRFDKKLDLARRTIQDFRFKLNEMKAEKTYLVRHFKEFKEVLANTNKDIEVLLANLSRRLEK